jgi:hypothetical protein
MQCIARISQHFSLPPFYVSGVHSSYTPKDRSVLGVELRLFPVNILTPEYI